jgi:hypothetical protein
MRSKIAWGITGFVAGNYLARRRQQRFEAEANKRLQVADQRIAEVSSDNARLQQRIDRMPGVAPAPAPAVYEQPQPLYNQAPVPMPTAHFEQPLYPQQPAQEQQFGSPVSYGTPRTEQVALTGQPVRYEQPLQQQFEQPRAPDLFAATPPVAELRQAAPMPGPAEMVQQPQVAEQMPQVIGEDGQQVVLGPGQRLERRGWYNVVVDEHGREVQGAIAYGDAFHAEQRQEQAAGAFTTADADNTTKPNQTPEEQDPVQRQPLGGAGNAYGGGGGGSSSYMGGGYGPNTTTSGMIGSGRVDPSHELQPGQPTQVDPNHRLSGRQNPIIATLGNPVLWLAFALLVIAYFIAALI